MKQLAIAIFGLVLLVPRAARAHFKLDAPASWAEQDALGMPQKSAPCGQADPGIAAVPTDAVTTLMEGSQVSITITETVFHPGHYRVALAAEQDALPADPVVTPGTTACGTAEIMQDPTLPVLADDLLDHASAFSGPQTVQVQLPPGMTCDHCVLQVIEFMSDHGLNNPGGCFYHHCAMVTLAADAPDAGDGGRDAGTGATGDMGGCCDAGGSGGGAWLGVVVLGLVVGRRRPRG